MGLHRFTYIGNDNISVLPEMLAQYRRIFFWGEMGVGKSTLAVQLLHQFTEKVQNCLLLELDPGAPLFGVPGSISLGKSDQSEIIVEEIRPLCTINGIRFRLPLILEASKLLNNAQGRHGDVPIIIDPPGVIRGVGGAELLMAFAQSLEPDVFLVLCKGSKIPFADELAALSLPVLIIEPPPEAKKPTKIERARYRTRQWDIFLTRASENVVDLQLLNLIGTVPPLGITQVWPGRQIAFLGKAGEATGMGEILAFAGNILTVKEVRINQAQPESLLIRDAGRLATGLLGTVRHETSTPRARKVPEEMSPAFITTRYSPPVSCHMGPAWITLLGGVFGDPLLHVRLRSKKRSFLFDLGDPARLQAKIAHQVEAVFISHAHLDHIGGFVWFLRSRIGPFGPCRIFGPEGTIDRIEGFLKAIIWDRIENQGPVFEVAEIKGKILKRALLQPGKKTVNLKTKQIKDGIILEDDSLNVQCTICDHNIPSVAYAIQFTQEISIRKDKLQHLGLAPGPWLGHLKHLLVLNRQEHLITLPDNSTKAVGELAKELTRIRPGKKMVYVADMADTAENREKIINLASGAHTLFCEAAFSIKDRDKAKATQHLTTGAAAQIASFAGVRRLVPFHFSKRYERNPKLLYEEICKEAGEIEIIGAQN